MSKHLTFYIPTLRLFDSAQKLEITVQHPGWEPSRAEALLKVITTAVGALLSGQPSTDYSALAIHITWPEFEQGRTRSRLTFDLIRGPGGTRLPPSYQFQAAQLEPTLLGQLCEAMFMKYIEKHTSTAPGSSNGVLV